MKFVKVTWNGHFGQNSLLLESDLWEELSLCIFSAELILYFVKDGKRITGNYSDVIMITK